MRKVLIDTSLIIEYLRVNKPEKTLFDRLFQDFSLAKYTSLIVFTEIFAGKSAVKTQTKIEAIFQYLTILCPTLETGRKAAEIIRETGIGLPDAYIAATAMEINAKIATLNVKDFSKVKELKLLRY